VPGCKREGGKAKHSTTWESLQILVERGKHKIQLKKDKEEERVERLKDPKADQQKQREDWKRAS